MAGEKKNIILQKRDIELITACHNCRILSRDQIRKLFKFGSISCLNARLQKLCANDYLEKKFLLVATLTTQAFYFLGTKGVCVVADILGIDAEKINALRRRNAKLGDFFLTHLIQTNDTRITFSLCPEIKLIRWVNEPEIRLDNNKKLRPDAFFQILYRNKLYNFFLETDNGTESSVRFVKTKVLSYIEMIKTGVHKKQFGINFFGVLVVVSNLERHSSLLASISKQTSGVFWFVEKDELNPDSVLKPIFAKAGQSERMSIFGGAR